MKIAKKEVVFENGTPITVLFKWTDGAPPTRIDLDQLNGMDDWFKAMGVQQKFGDAYSGLNDIPADRRVAEARKIVEDLIQQVIGNREWAKKGPRGESKDILAEAIHRCMEDNPATKSPGVDTIRGKLDTMDADEIKAMKAKWKTIDLEIEKIKVERKERKLKGAEDDVAGVEDVAAMFE